LNPKDVEQTEAIENERFYSNPPPDSGLSKPSEPPALPPVPTASLLAEQAAEDRHSAQIEHMKRTTDMLKLSTGKQSTSTPPPASSANPRHQSTNPSIQPSSSPAAASEGPR
jgi:hypothetical protein